MKDQSVMVPFVRLPVSIRLAVCAAVLEVQHSPTDFLFSWVSAHLQAGRGCWCPVAACLAVLTSLSLPVVLCYCCCPALLSPAEVRGACCHPIVPSGNQPYCLPGSDFPALTAPPPPPLLWKVLFSPPSLWKWFV